MIPDDAAVDAYRLAQQARLQVERIEGRIRGALALKKFAREKAWLADARAVVAEQLEALAPLLKEAQRLPELAHERENFARGPLNDWVDALEKLWAGISFHLGRRAPLLEALFPHTRFAPLRKAREEVARQFAEDLGRRLGKGYVQRMLQGDDCAFARPVLDEVEQAFARYQATLHAEDLAGEEAEKVRAALQAAAGRLEPAMKQARHLVEAAALTLPEPEEDAPAAGEDLREASGS